MFAMPAVALAVLLLTGCATLRHGTTQKLSIATDPEGAACVVTRAGEPAGRIDPTPGSIELARGTDRVEFVCTLAGYLDERDTIEVVKVEDLETYAKAVRQREAKRKADEEWERMSTTQKAGRIALVSGGVLAGLVLLSLGGAYGLSPVMALIQAVDLGNAAATGISYAVDHASGAAWGYSVPAIRLVPETFVDEAAREALFVERRQGAEATAKLAHDVLNETICKPPFLDFRCRPPRDRVDDTLKVRLDSLERQRAATRVVLP